MESLAGFFKALWESLAADWRPAVEIAVIAAAFYGLFRLLRGARSAGPLRAVVLAGALGLAMLVLVSQAAGLVRLQWVLERAVALAAVGAVVVFQPELRRGLARLTRSPLVGRIFRHESSAVEAVVGAAVALSREKRGALIAFQREDSLGSYVKGGVKLNAEPSADLIVSIFSAGSPLHDGAVVLRAGKIAAAGCLFPLTDNPQVSKSLGTRHRAGVGLTEETDAVAVVVSEESGRISVCVRGELMQGLSPEDLRGILRKLCPEGEQVQAEYLVP